MDQGCVLLNQLIEQGYDVWVEVEGNFPSGAGRMSFKAFPTLTITVENGLHWYLCRLKDYGPVLLPLTYKFMVQRQKEIA